MREIVVEMSSPVPVYEQIRAQVTAGVAVGTLRPGDRLPASRDLARDLGIAVGTVQRAYKELEISGLVESRRRSGTVIAGAAGLEVQGEVPSEQLRAPAGIVKQAQSLVSAARKAGIPDDHLLDILRGAIAVA